LYDLSVLICSTNTRYTTFGKAIQDQIWPQYDTLSDDDKQRVEILMLTDNKAMMLGQKRNVMVDAAQGKYVQFIDDDDRIEPDMLTTILQATSSDADVITFLVSVTLDDGEAQICRYSKDYSHDHNTDTEYRRLPNHICVVKRDVAQRVSFPNLLYGEDSMYSKLLKQHLRTQHDIDRVLYHYDYHTATTEAQEHKRGVIRVRPNVTPLVDIVMMSHAHLPHLRGMTQRAINTAISGANSLPINITVIEQNPAVRHERANTIHEPGHFNYNAFANKAAKHGSAQWIVVANNDLIFYDAWLHWLLASNHPVVSPKCPIDERQTEITENTTGYTNGVHFSGWCFMIKRCLWEQIGGFDECVEFWCSDDVVLEQLKAVDVAPMLVPEAKVEHGQSMTLKRSPDQAQLKWRQLANFETKYGRHNFSDDPDYLAWKIENDVVTGTENLC
jgi:GT2 family glycosyltransferase